MCVTVRGRGRLARECGLSARVGAIAHTHMTYRHSSRRRLGDEGEGWGHACHLTVSGSLISRVAPSNIQAAVAELAMAVGCETGWACVPRRFESCLLRQSDLIEDPVGYGVRFRAACETLSGIDTHLDHDQPSIFWL